jgi:repressor LexA
LAKTQSKEQDKIIVERITKLIDTKNVMGKDFATAIGVTPSTISEWKGGRQSPISHINKIADYFDVSVDYLLGRTDSPASFPNPKVLPDDYLPEGAIPLSEVQLVRIPIMGTVKAGTGGYAHDEIQGYDFITKEELNGSDASEVFYLRVNGDSMEPDLYEGDLVLVRKLPSVDSGALAVVIVDGEEGVVKIVEYGRNWIELISFNDKYAPRRFENAEVERVYIVGEVVASKRNYKKVKRHY